MQRIFDQRLDRERRNVKLRIPDIILDIQALIIALLVDRDIMPHNIQLSLKGDAFALGQQIRRAPEIRRKLVDGLRSFLGICQALVAYQRQTVEYKMRMHLAVHHAELVLIDLFFFIHQILREIGFIGYKQDNGRNDDCNIGEGDAVKNDLQHNRDDGQRKE